LQKSYLDDNLVDFDKIEYAEQPDRILGDGIMVNVMDLIRRRTSGWTNSTTIIDFKLEKKVKTRTSPAHELLPYALGYKEELTGKQLDRLQHK
jgi:hypothetical protein